MLRTGFVFDEPLRTPTYSTKFHTQAYRSGHNEAVLKTVRGNSHGGSNPSACAIKTNTIPRGWCLFLYHGQRGRTRRVRIPQAQSIIQGTEYSRYLRREEMSASIHTKAERLAPILPRAAYPSSCATLTLEKPSVFTGFLYLLCYIFLPKIPQNCTSNFFGTSKMAVF